MDSRQREKIVGITAVSALAVLVVVGMIQTYGSRQAGPLLALSTEPEAVMGTSCRLTAVISGHVRERGLLALREAEESLRRVEMMMSSWLEGSEISRFNAAGAGRKSPLSPESLHVLDAARAAYNETGGAFDITIDPLIALWRGAAERGTVPDADAVRAARAASSWNLIELLPDAAVKLSPDARVDLGGIAKGYAIDLAVEAMRQAGVEGGLVDVGGDLRIFGSPPDGGLWEVEVRDPFRAGRLGRIGIPSGAVCTSGNYSRFFETGGVRYSHIIDPRSGMPSSPVASATVVSDTAERGDIWATALSVLGREGMERLPEGMEAFLVVGDEKNYQLLMTPGFEDILLERPEIR